MSTKTTLTQTHETAPTRYVEANGVRFAYRRFGRGEGLPMLFCQHFTGTMDNWDPIVTNALAQDREVILFDNQGVGSSSGTTPDNVQAMATDALAFVDAIGLKRIDPLGFSPCAASAQCTLDPLSRCRARRGVPISASILRRGKALPG